MKKILLGLSLSLTLLSTPHVTEASNGFNDVHGHWAYNYVQESVDAGLMTGTGEKNFSPDGQMTIGQFAVVITNGALQRETATPKTEHWASAYLESLYNKGIFNDILGNDTEIYSSTSDDSWHEKPITREQAAFLIANVLINQEGPSMRNPDTIAVQAICDALISFSDIDYKTYAYEEFGRGIAVVVANEIMGGSTSNGNTVFNPKATMTRAEAAVIFSNMLSKGYFGDSVNASGTSNKTETPSTGTTTTPTTPNTGSTTTTPSTSKPTTAAGTPAYTNSDMGVTAERPDDVVAGSGQYNVDVYTVPADTNKDGWITYREVMTVLEALYKQYPHRTPWDDSKYYKSNIAGWGNSWGKTEGTGCAAFALMASDMIFGDLPTRKVTATANQDPHEVIRPGDVNHAASMGHWFVIAGTAYVEGYPALEAKMSAFSGNMNKVVMYGDFSSKYEDSRDLISQSRAIYYTRYPA